MAYSENQPIQAGGPLFDAVQSSGLFDDSKTFVDAVPKTDPDEIMEQFRRTKSDSSLDLKVFVEKYFILPGSSSGVKVHSSDSMDEHIENLWDQLERKPDQDVSEHATLLPLPHSYIVPGGRFREIYYWDSFFTMLGLSVSGRISLIKNMVNNFAHLIDTIGHIPNGNRSYYISRSQPPFFTCMVDLLCANDSKSTARKYLPQVVQEYEFWMQGADRLSNENRAHRRVVKTGHFVMNRYFDDHPAPREESYLEDVETAESSINHEQTYLHIRAAAESGWDFTSRWLVDYHQLSSIATTDIIPVDLNALVYFMECKIAEWSDESDQTRQFQERAEQRKEAYNQLFWNSEQQFYFDYNWKNETQTSVVSAAAVYPLYFGLADQFQADCVARKIQNELLKPGGLVTTKVDSSQQWDYPNGWAPLQWLAIKGLMNYQHKSLALEIGRRWIALNEAVFEETGKMMEKYNVVDLSLRAGGGEYPLQDGFGWTNGVALAIRELLNG